MVDLPPPGFGAEIRCRSSRWTTSMIVIDDSSDDETESRGGKGKGVASSRSAAASSSSAIDPRHVEADNAPDSLEGDNAACEACRRRGNPEQMVLCDRCEYGARHFFCFTPKIRKAPEDDWICRACRAMKRDDPLVQQCARISAKFEQYGVCEGEIQDVMWKDAEKKSGRKIYHVFYAPGDELWHDLDAQELEEEILPIDEVATKEQREKDPLLPHSEKRMVGARVVIFLDEAPGQKRGNYPGRVSNVRVERTGTVLHLIEFDAGDRHWYNLSDPKWRWKREGGGASRAKEEVRAELKRETSTSSQNDEAQLGEKARAKEDRKRKLDGLAHLVRIESNASMKSQRSSKATENEDEEEEDASATSSDDESSSGKQKRSGETPTRDRCRTWFVRALAAGSLAKATQWERELPAGVQDLLSRAIEGALREAKGSANGKPYRQQARKLASNFGSSQILREALWTGSLSVDTFVRMTDADLVKATAQPAQPRARLDPREYCGPDSAHPAASTSQTANTGSDDDDTPLVNYYGSLVPAGSIDRD